MKVKTMLDVELCDSLSYHMDILPTKEDSEPKYYNGIPSILATDKRRMDRALF